MSKNLIECAGCELEYCGECETSRCDECASNYCDECEDLRECEHCEDGNMACPSCLEDNHAECAGVSEEEES